MLIPATQESHQASEQPTDAPQVAADSPMLGEGLFSTDNASDDSESDQDQPGDGDSQVAQTPETAPEATATEPDDLTPEERQAGYMRQADYTRKTQDLAEMRNQVATQQQQLQQQQQQYQELLGKLQQQVTQGIPQQQHARDVLEDAMSNPHLSAEERQGLQMIDQVLSQRLERFAPLLEKMEQLGQLTEQFPQIQQRMESLSAAQQQEAQERAQAQLREAQEAFGPLEQLDASVRQLAGSLIQSRQTNPQTGRPFTLSEALGFASGKTVEEARAARQSNSQARRQAQRRTRTPAAPGGPTDTEGNISEAEAIAAIGATM